MFVWATTLVQTSTSLAILALNAKDFAPGQRMQEKDVKSQPGASEYAPGNLPNRDVKK
jgi:hypothetical protein